MARHIRNGTQDFIGAARPSIADPFLPKKIEEGRVEDVRECIGCNICYAHNSLGVPIRLTQNPTTGEEWRKVGIRSASNVTTLWAVVLVIGGGPAGLEAARVLGERGARVMLAEAERDLGGRVSKESRLPGLAQWRRVRDWRVSQLARLDNVDVFPGSPMNAADIFEVDAEHVLVATGARWATDGVGRHRDTPVETAPGARVLSVDEVLEGKETPSGRALIYDDDHYYLGPALALELRRRGLDVVLLTPAGRVGQWSAFTSEQNAACAALIDANVEIVTNRILEGVAERSARAACVFRGREMTISADWILPLTRREPNDGLYFELLARGESGQLKSVRRIGDCEAPGIMASAVYSGHRIARHMSGSGEALSEETRRERFHR